MEQEVDLIEELTDSVKDVQDTNRVILARLNDIRDLDSGVCTCSCHTSATNIDVPVELRGLNARIETLENLLQDLMSRERQELTQNYSASSRDKNVTDEYKQTHDVTNDRGNMTEPRASPRAHTREVTAQLQTQSDTRQVSGARGGQRLGGRPHQLHQYTAKTQSGVALASRTHGGRDEKENIENTGVAQQRIPREVKGILKHSSIESGKTLQLQNTRERTSAVRPRADEDRVSISQTTEVSSVASSEAVASIRDGDVSTRPVTGEGNVVIETHNDDSVRCIHQEETRRFADKHDWASLAQMELNSGKSNPQLNNLEGAHTAICLDISESMAKNTAWRQAKTFLLEYLGELARVAREHNVSDEYVAFVTFGHETRVVKRMTNKYDELRTAIERVTLGGPSPMYGGLYLALVALIHSENWTTTVNGVTVNSRLIVISDGMVTEARQQAGPDLMEHKPELATDLLTPLGEIVRRGIDVYCVPVGNANKSTMELLTLEVGHVWSREEGAKLARRYFLTKMMAPGITRGLLGPNFNPTFRSDIDFSDTDRLQMLEIFNQDQQRRWEEISRQREQREAEDMYADTDRDNLLAVGSRVRRGPDWQAGDADKEGPGTVVGHHRYMDNVWVMWDADPVKLYPCRYGEFGNYDVLPADDVRLPKPDGTLCVGCAVKPNAKTRDKHPDIQSFDRGVVVRTNGHKISVKWNSGTHETHHHQPGRLEEIDFCPSGDTSAPNSQAVEAVGTQNRPKNKNKNK